MVIILLALLGLAGFRFASSSGVNRELAEICKRGLPTNPEQLDAWYAAVPDDENAALLILEASREHISPSAGNDPSNDANDNEQLSESEFFAMREILAVHFHKTPIFVVSVHAPGPSSKDRNNNPIYEERK